MTVSYQTNETKAFAFVDENLAGFTIFAKQPLEVVLCDVVGQVADEQATALSVGLLARFQQHGQRRLKLLLNGRIVSSGTKKTIQNTKEIDNMCVYSEKG